MQAIARLVSLIAVGAIVLPCLLYFAGQIELSAVKTSAIAGTLGWFAATPLWMGRGSTDRRDAAGNLQSCDSSRAAETARRDAADISHPRD